MPPGINPNSEHTSETLTLKREKKLTSTWVFWFFLPLTQGDIYKCRILDNHVAFCLVFQNKNFSSLAILTNMAPVVPHTTNSQFREQGPVQASPLQ